MRQLYRYVLWLVLINFLIVAAGIMLSPLCGVNLILKDLVVLSFLFSVIAAVTISIFLRGQSRERDSQTMHTLVSISLKFLLDMILALGWIFISKKSSLASVFLFFVIYLTLTLFTVIVILKILRTRAL